MSALALLVAAQITELGTVDFPAGPARGTARFYLDGSEPCVEVTLHNDGLAPIWWRGVGLGCVSTHWIVPPVALDGTARESVGGSISCTMEKSAFSTEEQLAEWALAPGHASETWDARPFSDGWRQPPADVPPLDRWAWCHEFTLPRATPPLLTMNFECPALVLAWSRATGPRVFLSREFDVHYPHFDPFADEPFQRGLGPIPFAFGPLRGTARLFYEQDWPVVEWTLTNPLEREVWWSPRGVGSPLTWGFLELDFPEGAEVEDAWMFDAKIRRAHGAFALEPQSRFAPGETRSGRIAPFSYDPTGSESWQWETGPQGLQRWHFVMDSTWPSQGAGDGAAPRFLPTQLHFFWDARYGFEAGVMSPGRFRGGRPWKPFDPDASGSFRSASFTLGNCDATLLLRTWNGACELDVFNASEGALHWIQVDVERVTWLREPGADETIPPPGAEPAPWPTSGEALSERATSRVRLNVGEMESDAFDLGGESWFQPKDEYDYTLPSESLRPIAWPQERAPEHERDARRGWLRIRWDAARGLDVLASEAWPFS